LNDDMTDVTEGTVIDTRQHASAARRHRPTHHRPGGGFENPWPGSEQAGFLRLLEWVIIKRGLTRLLRAPDDTLFAPVPSSFLSPRAPASDISVTWVGHSTFLIQIGGANLLTDPIWSDRASPTRGSGPRRWIAPAVALDALPPIDVVLISHNHYDHLDDTTVRRIARHHPGAQWIVPLGLHRFLARRRISRVTQLDWWDETRVGPLTIGATPAQHFSARGLSDRNRTLWCGFAVSALDRRIFFAGDTGFHPEFARIGERFGPFDVALLPIGAYEPRWFMRPVHMNPEDALRAYQDLRAGSPSDRPTSFVPMHWGTFRLTDEPMTEPPIRLREAWGAAGLDPALLRVLRHGETHREGGSAMGDRE
jgi:N-acyl-phosphatidylethanolamine-hydrolysing phospholipase D